MISSSIEAWVGVEVGAFCDWSCRGFVAVNKDQTVDDLGRLVDWDAPFCQCAAL